MIRIKSPGRVCLFGEHQDYLGYPVIALAISKFIYLEAEKTNEPKFIIDLPDIQEMVEIPLKNKEVAYYSKRDYIRSGYNLFIRDGFKFNKGYNIKITGDIPINAGVASSSALLIAWLYFLNLISNRKLDTYSLAIEGFNAEVKEFAEGGGMMDHFSSVYGNLIYLKPNNLKPNLTTYDLKLDGFVLGNSLEKKDTVEDLIRVKVKAISAFKELKSIMPSFNPFTSQLNELSHYLPLLNKEHQKKIIGNIINRDITLKAKNLIENNFNLLKFKENNKQIEFFYRQLGNLLNLHHRQLKDNIQISTKKIDKIISKCLDSGAFGGKINGSGFGGTMFALFPNNEGIIKKIIEDTGGKGFIIKTSNGVEVY